MKFKRIDYSLLDLPELEESEFDMTISPVTRIDDPNDPEQFEECFSLDLEGVDSHAIRIPWK